MVRKDLAETKIINWDVFDSSVCNRPQVDFHIIFSTFAEYAPFQLVRWSAHKLHIEAAPKTNIHTNTQPGIVMPAKVQLVAAHSPDPVNIFSIASAIGNVLIM
jgi:hypothetical protein